MTEPQADISMPEPLLADVAFKANTGFLSVTLGDYDITVTGTGSKVAAIGPLTVTIEGGGEYTAIGRLDTDGDGGPPFGLILMDEFAP
ncbi:MAG: DUF4397 domain-containing protein [Woeseia sp.]|nr:DUF4397 domain-containing protein [Woeseia sp.]